MMSRSLFRNLRNNNLSKLPTCTRKLRFSTNTKSEDKHPLEICLDEIQFAMSRERSITIPIINKTLGTTFNLSNLAGHGSFMLLAISYLESDFLQLRAYAFAGLSLSIIFQYYREKPLWIPIRWNSLFLLINGVMILLLLNEENSLSNLPDEVQLLYENIFAHRGMKPLEFRYLMSLAERRVLRRGEVVVEQDKPSRNLYIVSSGQLNAFREKDLVASIGENQFVGEMSFIRMQEMFDRKRNRDREREKERERLKTQKVDAVMHGEEAHLAVSSDLRRKTKPALAALSTTATTTTESDDDSEVNLDLLVSSADVVCDDHAEAVVYSWSFASLRQLFVLRPALGVMMDRCISRDLSKKLAERKSSVPAEGRYRVMISELVASGHISEQAKRLLRELQVKLNIDEDRHNAILTDLGWTAADYAAGYKGGPTADVVGQYFALLIASLQNNEVSDSSRHKLRLFRRAHSIKHAHHVEMLALLDWTPDEYEEGHRAGHHHTANTTTGTVSTVV